MSKHSISVSSPSNYYGNQVQREVEDQAASSLRARNQISTLKHAEEYMNMDYNTVPDRVVYDNGYFHRANAWDIFERIDGYGV